MRESDRERWEGCGPTKKAPWRNPGRCECVLLFLTHRLDGVIIARLRILLTAEVDAAVDVRAIVNAADLPAVDVDVVLAAAQEGRAQGFFKLWG